ncbi:MAG: UPF0175 family protein [Chloroflexi bacterium]|nr:UPF0175 family protein [Chloroflexota bacterium]
MTQATSVTLAPELINILRPLTDAPLASFVQELTVLELYRRRQISSGKAAELLHMERFEFVRFAARQGIPFFEMSDEELSDELNRVEQLR